MAATITGKIVNTDETTASGITVKLYSRYRSADPVASVNTNDGGQYTFPGLAPGRYLVRPESTVSVFDPAEARADVETDTGSLTLPTLVQISASSSDPSGAADTDILRAILEAYPVWLLQGVSSARKKAKSALAAAFSAPPAASPRRSPEEQEGQGEETEADSPETTVAFCMNRYDTPNTPYYHNVAALAACLDQVGTQGEREEPNEETAAVTVAFCVNQYTTRGTPYWNNKLALAQCLALAGGGALEEAEGLETTPGEPEEELLVTPTYCLNRYNTPGTPYYHNQPALEQCLSQC